MLDAIFFISLSVFRDGMHFMDHTVVMVRKLVVTGANHDYAYLLDVGDGA